MPGIRPQRKGFHAKPFLQDLKEAETPGPLSTKSLVAPQRKARKRVREEDADQEGVVPERLSKRILTMSRQQRNEAASEDYKNQFRFREAKAFVVEEDEGDEDELGFDQDDQPEFFDPECNLTQEEIAALDMFMPTSAAKSRNLADLVMEKILESKSKQEEIADLDAAVEESLDPKVVTLYRNIGKQLSYFKSGKFPKAFTLLPRLPNWQEIVFLTNPDEWTPNTHHLATKIFTSAFKQSVAQRYFNLILLPAVRENIGKYKRLNFHLYQACKRAYFKPKAFNRGFVIPLCQDGMTVREGIIIGALIAKISIPSVHSAALIFKLIELDYSGPTTFLIRILINKKYALPQTVISGLLAWFRDFKDDQRKMPVIWHQCLLTFVQRYKMAMTLEQRNSLKGLMQAQFHHQITPECRRELFVEAPREEERRRQNANPASQIDLMDI